MSSAQSPAIKEKVAAFPDSPGVYFMKNRKGRVLYVGKAKSLSARARSYVQKPEALDVKTRALMRAADTIDYIATASEVDALILECTLIKEHRPRYNIRLKDDKRYPYLKLTVNERFPRLLLVRRVHDDGAEYFGPYTDANAVRRTMRTIREVFPLRDCGNEPAGRTPGRECLNFQIGRCRAPCTGRISEDEYRGLVEEVRLFLRGRGDRLAEAIRDRMWRLAREKRYEEAASARDQLDAFERISERRRPVRPHREDEDFLGLAREGNLSCGVVLRVRGGTIAGTESFILPAAAAESTEAVLEAFLELYYHAATDVPPRVYVPLALEAWDVAATWLSGKSGKRVRISVPRKGERRSILDLAAKNAVLHLATETRASGAPVPALQSLKELARLPRTPGRIEGYDISAIQGTEAVGSMVVFERGAARKSQYRHFKIRGVHGADDYAMMREVLSRRLAHLKEGKERRPDLIMVDGGRGQVAAARAAMDELGVGGVPVVGLAKRNEDVYLEGNAEPVRPPRRSPGLRLLQRVRDEAHRFAVTYHRKLRGAAARRSALEDVPGIGKARRTALLVHFGSLDAVRRAAVVEIARVPGIGEALARVIHEHFHAVE
jgi:excinuclease ABC subunit C